MIHRVHSLTLAEVNRILELIQKGSTPTAAATPTISTTYISSGVASSGSSTPVTPVVPIVPVVPPSTSTTDLLTGEMVFPEILLSSIGDILTDENGYALVGVRVESQVMTGASDTIQAMSVTITTSGGSA